MTRFQSFRIVTTPLTRLPFVSAHEFRFWFVATFAFARSLSSFPLSLPLLFSPSYVSFAVRGNGNMLSKQKKQKPDSPRLYRAIFAERMTTKRERRIVFVLCARQQTLWVHVCRRLKRFVDYTDGRRRVETMEIFLITSITSIKLLIFSL